MMGGKSLFVLLSFTDERVRKGETKQNQAKHCFNPLKFGKLPLVINTQLKKRKFIFCLETKTKTVVSRIHSLVFGEDFNLFCKRKNALDMVTS